MATQELKRSQELNANALQTLNAPQELRASASPQLRAASLGTIIEERESNNSFAQNIGNFSANGNTKTVRAQMSSASDIDLYYFSISGGTKADLKMQANTLTGKKLELYQDINNNGGVDASDRFIVGTRNNLEGLTSRKLGTGAYIVKIEDDNLSSTSPVGSYDLTLSTSPSRMNRSVFVNVRRVTAIDRFDTPIPFSNVHRADFDVLVSVNGGAFQKKSAPSDKDDVTINFGSFHNSVTDGLIPVKIRVVDRDNRFDNDDVADISTATGRDLDLFYNSATRQFFGGGIGVTNANAFATIQGTSGPRARVELTVSHSDLE